MVSWCLRATENKKLDVEKILKYSLVYDLPEIYAKDTPLYRSNDDSLNSKKTEK